MLADTLKQADQELRSREDARDQTLTRARRARQSAKLAILNAHNDDYEKSSKNIAETRRLLTEIQPVTSKFPELVSYEETEAAYEEYAEAGILLSLETKGLYPSPDELSIPVLHYVLGLADVPGELRRECLDELRAGNAEKAEAYLNRMEEIYISLTTMEDAPLLLKGLRRKLDIIRAVLEATRAEITAEAGRRRLADAVRQLSGKLEK